MSGGHALGVVRRIDDLGRVVIPKEVRQVLGFAPGVPVEILIREDGAIVLRVFPGIGQCAGCNSPQGPFVPIKRPDRAAGLKTPKQLCLPCAQEFVWDWYYGRAGRFPPFPALAEVRA
jgi:AbrB family looped-hinge helix DNA binding protein